MKPLDTIRLQQIASAHGIDYDAPPDEETEDIRVVRTVMSREFAVDREAAFTQFADPQRHVDFFEIIKSSTPLIPLEGPLRPGEFIVLEHVQEEELPPRMMVVKYNLEPPTRIRKEAVTDPFVDTEVFSDRKKGIVEMRFDDTGRNSTRLTIESSFATNKGPVFVRGFIDHVWLNFFERLMMQTGELERANMLTAQ